MWDILTHGTSNRVAIFDAEGRAVYANALANAEHAGDRGTIVGSAIDDFMPADVAAEWKGLLRRAMQGRRPLVVEGMVHGSRYRANVQPVGDGENGFVLVVSRNVADLSPTDLGPRPGVEVVHAKANDLGVLADLTEREMEVLELVGEGHSTAEIARRLDRSVKTVEWHRAALGSKLGITNRVELARIAIGAGLCRTGATPPSRKNGSKVKVE
jgi:DNA-binding CsgD family transcriptional regulator